MHAAVDAEQILEDGASVGLRLGARSRERQGDPCKQRSVTPSLSHVPPPQLIEEERLKARTQTVRRNSEPRRPSSAHAASALAVMQDSEQTGAEAAHLRRNCARSLKLL